MEKHEQIRVLRALLAHLDAGTTVDAGGIRRNPTSAYTCPERATKEWERLFRGHPQLVGMSGDLPSPHRFFTRDDFGLPVLATRDAAGRFRAFANVCRHRGVVVERAERGARTHFACPFHGWTYDASGALVGLPMPKHFGCIDRGRHGLVELPADERHGLLWVHPRPAGALDVDRLLSGLAPEFAAWNFERLVHVGDDVYQTSMNWKLAIDTFGETYHFPVLHRNSLAAFFHGNVQAYDTYGRNHRMTLCLRSIDDLRRIPEEAWDVRQGAFPVYYLFPNAQVNVGLGGVTLVRVYPLAEDPRRSVSKVSFYLWPETLERDPGQARELQRRFAEVIRDEDYVAAAASQLGADAELPGEVVFGRNEPALHHYHQNYREALDLEPLPLLES